VSYAGSLQGPKWQWANYLLTHLSAVVVYCLNDQDKSDKFGIRIAFFWGHNIAKTVWRMGSARIRWGSLQRSSRALNWISWGLFAAGKVGEGRVEKKGGGREKGKDRDKPGWERLRMICARSTLAWRQQDGALWTDRHIASTRGCGYVLVTRSRE